MKQLHSMPELLSLIDNLEDQEGFEVQNFHPDFLRSFIKEIGKKVFITIPDIGFDPLMKHLVDISEKNNAVFITDSGLSNNVPLGFSEPKNHYYSRACEILANGLSGVDIVVSTDSGKKLPIIGRGVKNKLSISKGTSLENCCSFLIEEKYLRVDFVSSVGEYAVRGGIVDVFLCSRRRPYRISFMDILPIIYEFDIYTQLTGRQVPDLDIVSVSENVPLSLNDIEMDDFLFLSLSESSCLTSIDTRGPLSKHYFNTITHREFCELHVDESTKATTDSSLSAIGFYNHSALIVPGWFVDKAISEDWIAKKIVPLALSDIKVGDYLVHRDHGLSLFMGLVQKDGDQSLQEFVSLKFADGASILIDSARLDLISFYAPSSSENIKLDSLSKKGVWNRKKLSAKNQAEDTITSLLNLYVKRSDLRRDAYLKDFSLEADFISSFPYMDTPDQARAWEEISKDLASAAPMDRLLCGDVGFGKTELAIRAAFRVVLSKKRVVILSPTTILANQLYSSFLNRMDQYGVSVDMISRFRSKKECVGVQGAIENGLNDVLIGTHAVLNKDIYLKNIGLVVIDEEHRFGVKHKERIKEFKSSVDVLSMSATPIPRSMNLAISKIYSVSTLQTPPRLRLPIKTTVEYYNFDKIKEAIVFEIDRGGQVYFVHNDVSSIARVSDMIGSLLENEVVDYIHGQEPSGVIEKKMMFFINGKIDVLVCTTIIESGIDVPTANCIIINNSHLFGLSQLYQMRGRVGRGRQQAYAYLLIPRGLSLSDKSFKRIKSIENNTNLGSGYNISMTDMEIRGSGSLFGYKQSGGSGSLGYEMYTKLIQRVLHESGKLESGFQILPEDVVVKVYQSRYIPEAYIALESTRMSIYKNITNATTKDDLDNILYNLKDRFGPVPLPIINLVNEFNLRLISANMGISSIQKKGCGIVFSVAKKNDDVYIRSLVEYVYDFFNAKNIEYHILPQASLVFSVCIHLREGEDIYTFFSRFLGKFESL